MRDSIVTMVLTTHARGIVSKRNVHRFVTMVTTNVIWYATEMIAHKYATLIHVIWIARGQRAIRLATQM